MTLFDADRQDATLQEAIALLREALVGIPERHPSYVVCMNNLGVALGRLARHTRDPAALREAATALRHAVRAAPDDHPPRAAMLQRLGRGLRDLFDEEGDDRVLAEALAAFQEAAALTTAPPIDRVGASADLAVTLMRAGGSSPTSSTPPWPPVTRWTHGGPRPPCTTPPGGSGVPTPTPRRCGPPICTPAPEREPRAARGARQLGAPSSSARGATG